ncbi:MAG: ATP-dependent DNA helicase RecG [Rhodothermaceae bacterium]|nr:putative DNA binding domain-containing protein [Bacteroidota bacterium]MXW14886.1 ATP-dependent DNA helicase RecG [Rhodothermaceae bacterium]MXW32382.1 ATP-dependent DNA helicase RecG [Rhodothermaceae bacterium]MXZ17387.1 ATP-dependent DNA helicase RecG [Rhodothermaceae bacterium]MYC03298.1 ATP-dependent DNA helicase RecG [Rhodothermaceae bacterium]
MTKKNLFELIAAGENSRVEFKRDRIQSESLAKEMSALLNLSGGIILLGVEDDGQITGLTRDVKIAEEWVMNIARQNIQPSVIPIFTTTIANDKLVGIVEVRADSPSKPYKAKRGKNWVSYVRVGSTSREATREEEGGLYQTARLVRYETKPVQDTGLESLDIKRIENYFRIVLKMDSVPRREHTGEWQQLLLNSDFLTRIGGDIYASVAGLLLFGQNPNRRLPQAGITAVKFPGVEKEYNTIDEERIRGPLTPIKSEDGDKTSRGVIDRSIDFVKRNIGSIAWLDGGIRRVKKALPLDAVREAIVNAVTHRDYTREGTDIEISMYADRLEIISPGSLPNGVTVDKMKQGVVRVARNELIKEILRDYGYMEHFGMGVRNRIIRLTRDHNGTEPDLIADEDRFKVCLWFERRV